MVRPMQDYDPSTYGELIAGVYDRFYATLDERMVPLLAELAGDGRVLELGIGTGRVALPLKAAGVCVEGIDASPSMVARMREKPGGADIPVVLGDFRELPVEGQFDLVYVVFNTFFGLLTQDDQVRCFEAVASHLVPGGAFLLELFVPDPTRYQVGRRVNAIGVSTNAAQLDVSILNAAEQRVDTQHVLFEDGAAPRLFPVSIRFAFPSEVDLMARIARLRLRHRWGGWAREPFTSDSSRHISVYEKPR
jgi:SAM-dependent methyltransferase